MRRVLLVVDMQNDFVHENGALSSEAARAIVPFVVDQVRAALKAGDDVIFTLDSHDPDDKEFEKFPPHCLNESWGHELIAELKALFNEDSARQVFIISKSRYSGFYQTNLEQLLGLTEDSPYDRVDEVRLVGVCTNICCYFTAEELANRDVPTTVYAQGVASFDQAAHEFALSQMKDVLGAQVI